jgi:hypothetical protein
VGLDRLDEEVEQVAALAAAGLDRRQHPLDETAPDRRVGAEAGLAPADRVTQGPLGGVVVKAQSLDEGRKKVWAEV